MFHGLEGPFHGLAGTFSGAVVPYVALPLITAKLNTGASEAVPPVVAKLIWKLPAPTAVTLARYRLVPDFTLTTTVSVAATVELVTVKLAHVEEPAAEKSVIAPDALFSVTPVVREVI